MDRKFEFTVVDLFAGIGGIRKGFEKVGGKCVFTSEWDKFSVQTYKANFPDNHEIHGDITDVNEKNIPDHDVLLAGFPCQPFSLAGVSKKKALGRKHGFEDETQGTLFFDVARIIAEKRPKAFLLENVKNLVSHDKGNTFRVMKGTLTDLGYYIDYKVISAAAWVPQKRERIFIVGFRDTDAFSLDNIIIPDTNPTLASILHKPDEEPEEGYTERKEGVTRVLDRYTLSDKLWSYLDNYGKKHAEKGNGFGCSVVGAEDVARTLSARYCKDGSEILIKQVGKNPRMLTPRECSRLMGFDRPKSKPLKIPVSNNQAWRQFGNAVCVPVIEAIANSMRPHLG
ncbi:DNA (cytosine-5-)-methyltransferase [Verrucomicrobia bacterium]|nr:DNA (cytosine-5-)-methyltransferase [Verrucomicrobiota bacterium]